MEVVYGIDNYRSDSPSCVTVGTFDGLHIGHREILRRLVDISRAEGLRSVAITFDPHPRQVLAPGVPVNFVLTRREKLDAFRDTGVDCLIVHPFSHEFASLKAEEFLQDLLCKRLNMRHLVKGFNNHFGADRLSSPDAIRDIGVRCGFDVTQVSAESTDGVQVSSTLIRKLVSEGQVYDASRLLGYFYPISGVVAHGREIGRTMGFPTANIMLDDSCKILPAPGAYAAVAMLDGREFPTMLNIGSNPTVNSDGSRMTLEAHLIGFSGDLYGSVLSLRLIERLREERRFPSLDALRAQLEKDSAATISICRREFPQIVSDSFCR